MSAIKKDFIKHLKVLQDKRKDVIESLTKICATNEQHAQVLVETIFEEFKEARIERKVALLFLIDSILKSCKERYLTFIEEGVIEAFCDAYVASSGKPDIRKSLRLLFKTWEIHFPAMITMSIMTNIKVQVDEDINASLSVEELDSLIAYYKKNGQNPQHLILQKKMLTEGGAKKIIEKKPPKEKTSSAGSLYIPPEVEMALHKKPEKKAPPEEEGPTPKLVKKVPKQVGQKVTSPPQPKVSAQTNIPPPLAEGERYKIKKKDGKGERERQSLEKEEQTYAPITKAVKTEIRPGAVPRHEEHPHGTGYGQQSTGYMYRSQKDMPESSRPMMSSQASHRQYGSYYQTPSFEGTEAQFSDDETYQQTKPSNIPQQGQFQSQFQHKYPSQAQGQARPQMQQRDQHHMRLQHPSYHPGPQQPHPYPSQTQMGQFPQQRAPVQAKGSMQPQPLTKQGQPMHHMQQHHPAEFQPHYSGQTPMQASIKTRPSPNEPMQFQPLSPQSQMPPHFGSHQMPIEGGAQKTLQGQQTMGQKVPRRELLMQIKQTIENSRNPVPGSEAGAGATRMVEGSNLPDFEYPCNTNMLTIGTRKGSEISDQSNVLVFKPLLTFIKRQLPNSIKMKYQQKIGNPESLSSILGRVVDSLYDDLPYRCSSCGMRFTNKALLNKHLDWHFQHNMELKEKTKTMNLRPQLITNEHWIKDEGSKNYKTSNIENAEEEYEFENYVPGNGVVESCKACGETFKEVWDKTKEIWLLDGAAKVKYDEEEPAADGIKQKVSNFDLMHFRCYKLCLQNETK